MINQHSLNAPLFLKDLDTAIFSHLLMPNTQIRLIEEFPEAGFTLHSIEKDHPNCNIPYQFHGINLGTFGEGLYQKILSDYWIQFFKEVSSTSYKENLSQLFGISLKDCKTRLEMSRYGHGDYMEKHYDREPKKRLTQLFYFNKGWSENWGANFNVLDKENTENIVFSVPPLSIYSVAVLCTNKAWHEVTKNRGPDIRKAAVVEYFYQ